ncbi:MAG: PP2C family protein-serine/threonine phosphatase [Fervidobacterium sp.]
MLLENNQKNEAIGTQEFEKIKSCFANISKLFEKDFSITSPTELVNACLLLEKHIKNWLADQKANNDALQQLIDAQLEELSAAYEGLSALFEINKIISAIDEPWTILKNILKFLRNAITYTVGVIKLEIESKSFLEYYSTLDLEQNELEKILKYFEIELGNTEETIFVDYNDEMGGFIYIPLSSEIGRYGYLAISSYGSNKFFTAGDKKIAEAVAQQIFTAVNRYIVTQREIEKKRLEEQLQIAKTIQQGLLPREFPKSKFFDIYASSKSAVQVGGDYYDVISGLDETITCCVADVSGKGLPAALIMSSFRSMFRLSAYVSSDLRVLASRFDKMINSDFEVGRFITAIIFKIDTNGNVEIINAGHDPLYIVRNNKIIRIESTGTPFGIIGDFPYESELFQAEKGDVFVAFTDGVVEARNMYGEEFGFERLEEILIRNKYLSAQQLVEKIMNSVFEFSQGTPQHDDTTVLVLKYE